MALRRRDTLLVLLPLLLFRPTALRAQSFCEAVAADPGGGITQVLGNGAPGSVTTAAIQNALNTGGRIRFNVGSTPTTIVLTATLVINRAAVLDGGGVVTLSGGGARRIIQITNTQNQTYAITLQGLTFANGNASPRGGAIYKDTGGPWQAVSLKLVNCAFNDNAAMPTGQDDGGGAIYATGMDHVQIGNTTFTNNSGSNGGAVYTLGTKRLTIVDSTFTSNRATGTGGNPGNGGNAGALGVDGAVRLVDVCRTRFVSNTSNAFGAGFFSVMYDNESRTRFEDSVFDGNRQLSAIQHSGGAYVQGGPFAFERVSFLRNEANGYGGLFVGPSASGAIRNGTFVGNVARQGLGAAIAIDQSAVVSIVNTTIAGNVSTAAFAAGISIGASNHLRLTNVILANNTGGNRFVNWNIQNPASQDGGGNLQWPASRPSNGGAETAGTPSTVFADPLLAAAAANNGGAVPTLAIGDASPARNSGVAIAEVPPTDARGVARVGTPDRGSYEIAPPLVRPALWHGFFAVDTRETPYVGDFDGDGQADIITFTRDNPASFGDVYVALSDGTKFGDARNSAKWHDFFAISPLETVVIGDYDGDGADDIATWLGTTSGQVYVALSLRTGMAPEHVWLTSLGRNPSDVILAGDVDGDGKKDLVDFARREGKVYVALSTGSSFRAPVLWHNFFAVSTYERPQVADLNGDGKADIVTFATDSPTAYGDVYVAISDGTKFGDGNNSLKWHDFFAIDPNEAVRVGDLGGDGREDFFTFLPPARGGALYTVQSQGNAMGPNVLWPDNVRLDDRDRVATGDVNGDGRVDIVVFAQGEGKVYVALAP